MKTKKQKNIQSSKHSASELSEPLWSIITFEGVFEKDLTYPKAAAKMKNLTTKKIPGLCIITNDAAEKSLR